MFIILNVILVAVIFKIERSKDPKFGKIIHLIVAPFIVLASIGGTIILIAYLILSNIKSIYKFLNSPLHDPKL